MAASQATMEAMKRESRANAKEDVVTLASEARQKVDHALASVQGLGGKIIHPFDAGARGAATTKSTSLKRQSSEKQANIRDMARQMAVEERLAARNQVAQQVLGGAGGMRYPVPVYPPSDGPSEAEGQPPAAAAGEQDSQGHHPQASDAPPVQHPPRVDGEAPQNSNVEHSPVVEHREAPKDSTSESILDSDTGGVHEQPPTVEKSSQHETPTAP